MKMKQATISAAVAGLFALGAAGQAFAGVYAGSRTEYQNLFVSVTNVTSGGVNSFNFNLNNSADLGGAVTAFSGNCAGVALLGTNTCGAYPGVALNAQVANAGGSVPVRADNNFNFLGPGAGQTYSSSDSQITTAQLAPGTPAGVGTSGKNIAETEIAVTGTGQASTTVQSTTQFSFTFSVASGGTFELNFEADPDLYVAVDTANLLAAIAQANSGVTFTLTGSGTAQGVSIQWTPDGLAGGITCNSPGSVVTCTELNDEESLNNSVGLPPNTNPGSEGISDTRSGNDLGFSLFGIRIAGLLDGNYSATLNATNSTNATQVVQIPEPGVLMLFGAALAGMGFTRRRRFQRA